MTVVKEKEEGKINWLKYKINYGLTYEGMIVFIIVWEFVIVLILSTLSQPVMNLINAETWLKLDPDPIEKAGRLIYTYHALAYPFVAVVTFFVMKYMNVREKFKSRVKWPLFIGTMLSSATGILNAYVLPDAWLLHGLFIVGCGLSFYAGILLLIGVFPTKSFPERDPDAGRNIFVEQLALTLLVICILGSVLLGASVGAYFGNGLTVLQAEYFLRYDYDIGAYVGSVGGTWEKYPVLFVDAIKGHLHIMLGLIDVAILLMVYRYTVPDQKGRWYLISMLLAIPGFVIMSIGCWLVSISEWIYSNVEVDIHYLIYAGSAILVTVGLILALTGWSKTSKDVLGDSYESASWFTRIKAVFRDPLKFTMYFQFIWVNFVMTFTGIFLALSLHHDSILTERLGIISFRDGPYVIEETVARGHWHVLAVLSAILLLLFLINILDIQGKLRNIIAWCSFAGSILAFLPAAIYMYFPHFDQVWAKDWTKYASVEEFWVVNWPGLLSSQSWLTLLMDIGIALFAIIFTIFCFYQLIQILKGRKDVLDFPE